MGRIFLPLICKNPLTMPHTVVARSFDEARVLKIRTENGIPDFYPTKFIEAAQFADYLDGAHKEIDGFLVLGTSSSHLSYVKLLAPYKKPIFMEKPLTENKADSIAAIEIL